ncbi:DUF3048 domain-containing protein [Demequina activiva]|uniref:Lipoprotein YerB n=1 Tax=Demequina activiva TaxID=1582364 RepID=A0A919ULP4_9MICO|nr:DUF3048 domain-containing protein [Demequina activiva]GIG54913.1 putative lipoprotein YerB [Demequina activiva]
MKSQRIASVSALATAIAVGLTACASSPDVESGPATTASIAPTPERTIAPSPPEDPRPDVVWPLTGVDAESADPTDLERPALSIKIENSDNAKPQSNLQYADIVFEEQVEYGISRLVAIYHSETPETVGPIRSMRPMDRNIMGSLEGPLVFSGAQRGFISAAQSSGQELIAQDTGGYGFFRTSDKPAPHNLHGTLADFYAQTDATAPPQQFEYAYPSEDSNVIAEGTATTTIDIYASPRMQPQWDWDESAGAWMRSEAGTPHTTSDGTQLSATNVVVLWVDIVPNSSGGGSAVPETVVVTDSGTGYVAAEDTYVPITWSKAGQFDPYVLETESGEVVELVPGKTWVELVPQSGGAGKGTVAFS